jgi:hypothetical protein
MRWPLLALLLCACNGPDASASLTIGEWLAFGVLGRTGFRRQAPARPVPVPIAARDWSPVHRQAENARRIAETLERLTGTPRLDRLPEVGHKLSRIADPKRRRDYALRHVPGHATGWLKTMRVDEVTDALDLFRLSPTASA